MIIRVFSYIFSALLITACGFTPVHAPSLGHGAAFKNLQLEIVSTPDSTDKQVGFFLSQRLHDRIGHQNGDHVLKIQTRSSQNRLGLSGDDIASRYDVKLSVRYELIDKKSRKTLDSGTVEAAKSFSAPTDPYALQSSQSNALQLIAADVADRLLVKMARYYARTKHEPPK